MSHIIFLCHSRRPSNHTHDVHLHVMQCPHQQQRMTRQIFSIPRHFNRGPRDTPRQQGCNVHISNNEWHIINLAFHVISTGVHVRPHVSKGTNEKIDVVTLPTKNLLVWSPRALHVPLREDYGGPCFMWRHIKTCWNWPCFHMSMGRFFPVWHDGF